MRNINVEVSQKTVEYPIKIEKGLLHQVGEQIITRFSGRRAAIITDKNVFGHYGETVKKQLSDAGIETEVIVLEPGEETKTFHTMSHIYSQLIEMGITRSDLIVALGGGVIGDISGFVAATFLRGIAFVQIPTTLLAQVDSSVGGKVGVDLPEGKNLAGAFYHPMMVLIDPLVLDTLTDAYFSDGMAEVIKYGCIKDEAFFTFLNGLTSRQEVMAHIEAVIETCCTIKNQVVRLDEKDTGERMLLNFGHTLGHAIESFYEYKKYTHGQAIAIGMVKITELAEQQGRGSKALSIRIRNCLTKHQLPVDLDDPEDYASIIPYIKKDKKNLNDCLNVILLESVGRAERVKSDITFFDALKTGGQHT